MWITWIVYILTSVVTIGLAYQVVRIAEYTSCVFRHQIPFISTSRHCRTAIVRAINDFYPHARTVCEIGSGYGGLARKIARNCAVDVIALENMPFCAMVSRAFDRITGLRCRTIWCDAFDYLSRTERFDVAIAYMGPSINNRVAAMRDSFKVLILVDVPADDITPTHTIDVGHGATRYGRRFYPHKLFIYEFEK